MRDQHCIFCRQICRGRATGKNEYIRHNGGLMHTRCMEPYKEDLNKRYYPNSRTLRVGGHSNRDPVKKAAYMKTWYQKNRTKILSDLKLRRVRKHIEQRKEISYIQ